MPKMQALWVLEIFPRKTFLLLTCTMTETLWCKSHDECFLLLLFYFLFPAVNWSNKALDVGPQRLDNIKTDNVSHTLISCTRNYQDCIDNTKHWCRHTTISCSLDLCGSSFKWNINDMINEPYLNLVRELWKSFDF